nr:immunoglobulin light chain junction region [Macaca mulatta]
DYYCQAWDRSRDQDVF